jgi:hypothetical protein
MFDRKGVANSTYALLTSTALITGLMLLSFSGNPYSLAGETGQQNSGSSFNPDTGNFSLPENTSINASNPISPENASQSIEGNQGIVTELAKGLFKAISGREIQPGNQTLPNETGTTTPENQTIGDNTTTPDDPQRPDIPENTTGDNTTQNISQPTQNETFNESDFNQSMPDTNNTDSEGLLAGIAKTISNLFNTDSQPSGNQTDINQTQDPSTTPNNDTSENPDGETPQNETTETPPQEGEEPQERNNTQQSGDTESSTKESLPTPDTQTLLAIIAVIAALSIVILFYRSDKNLKEFLKALADKLKSFVTSIPDLFRRSIVNTVSLIVSKIAFLADFSKKAAKAPTKTLHRIKESIIGKINRWKKSFNQARNRSVKKNISLLLTGKDESYEGLDQVWHELKKKLNLENDRTVTPAEVRAEAIKQNLPDDTVSEIVEAFRKDKYSSEGFTGKQDISKWNQDLQGDEK